MPRIKGNARAVIMEKALELFAVQGFEAVSVRAIADAVGIGNSALYKHFESKQAIFDALVEDLKARYLEQCESVNSEIRGLDAVRENCLKMFEYQTRDEGITRFRQLLLIEKFRNPRMAALYREFFVDTPINRQREIFARLQAQGLMVPGDTYVYAMELYAPFYLYHFVEYDYETLRPRYLLHIEHFFETHFITRPNMKDQKEDHHV